MEPLSGYRLLGWLPSPPGFERRLAESPRGPVVVTRAASGAGARYERAIRVEIEALDALVHPGWPRRLEAGLMDGRPAVVSGLADTIPLGELRDVAGPSGLPRRVVLEIGVQAAGALARLHGSSFRGDALTHGALGPAAVEVSRGGFVRLLGPLGLEGSALADRVELERLLKALASDAAIESSASSLEAVATRWADHAARRESEPTLVAYVSSQVFARLPELLPGSDTSAAGGVFRAAKDGTT